MLKASFDTQAERHDAALAEGWAWAAAERREAMARAAAVPEPSLIEFRTTQSRAACANWLAALSQFERVAGTDAAEALQRDVLTIVNAAIRRAWGAALTAPAPAPTLKLAETPGLGADMAPGFAFPLVGEGGAPC